MHQESAKDLSKRTSFVGDTQNSDQTATLAQDGHDPGMADTLGTFDAGGFSDIGEDFGSGDFGGGSD
jgi:hypothetical protein